MTKIHKIKKWWKNYLILLVINSRRKVLNKKKIKKKIYKKMLYIEMSESISKNNELENEMTLDMSNFWYSDVAIVCLAQVTS